MRWLCQPTNDLITIEFSVAQWLEHLSSVWKVVGQIPIWCSEFFSCSSLYSYHSSYWLCFSFQISNDECGDESFLGSTSELHQQ